MQALPPSLLPLLRSRASAELLAWLYLHPEQEYSATDLARLVRVSQATVSRDADRLIEAGLLTQRHHGRLRLLQAAQGTIITRPLTDLLAATFGPLPVLTRVLHGIRGIEHAYIYGSWAARYRGEPGAIPRDIDVVIVGDADDDELYDAARAAEGDLGREVNIRRVSLAQWTGSETDPFLTSVRSRPLVQLDLDGETAP